MAIPVGTAPGASTLMSSDSIAQQVQGETEEQRRKRLASLQASKMLPSTGASSLGLDYGAAVGGV